MEVQEGGCLQEIRSNYFVWSLKMNEVWREEKAVPQARPAYLT